MKLITAVAGAVALGLSLQANAVVYTANVTLTWGDVATDAAALGTNSSNGPQFSSFLCEAGYNGGGIPGPCFSGNFDGSGDKTWTSSGGQTLALTPTTTTYFSQRNSNEDNAELGNNGTSFYNPWDQHVDGIEDYTSVGENNCIAANTLSTGLVAAYACVNTTTFRSFSTPVKNIGPAPTATGTVTIDTVAGTMTGTLNVAAYNYRFADGAPFGGAAQDRISGTGSTLALNLTGVFPPAGGGAWQITGGTAAFADTAFTCENAPGQTTLCGNVGVPNGSHRADGSHLSWVPVPVRDSTQGNFTVPGVVGAGGINAAGGITSSSGEFHRYVGMTALTGGGPCNTDVVYNPVQQTLTTAGGQNYLANITCGIMTAGIWNLTGTVTTDWDGDGIPNGTDNCSALANNTGATAQRDTNADGYGNLCDPDFNGDVTVNINDFNRLKARLNISPVVDVDTDLDGNGAVNINDLNRLKSFLGKAPGPSGLHP